MIAARPLASFEFTGGVLTYFGFHKLTFKGLYSSHHLLSVDSHNQHLYHKHEFTIISRKTCGCHFLWPMLELDTLSFIMYSCYDQLIVVYIYTNTHAHEANSSSVIHSRPHTLTIHFLYTYKINNEREFGEEKLFTDIIN